MLEPENVVYTEKMYLEALKTPLYIEANSHTEDHRRINDMGEWSCKN